MSIALQKFTITDDGYEMWSRPDIADGCSVDVYRAQDIDPLIVAAVAMRDRLRGWQDAGPEGEGWQSDELIALLAAIPAGACNLGSDSDG